MNYTIIYSVSTSSPGLTSRSVLLRFLEDLCFSKAPIGTELPIDKCGALVEKHPLAAERRKRCTERRGSEVGPQALIAPTCLEYLKIS